MKIIGHAFFMLFFFSFISCHQKEPWQHHALRNTDLRYDMAKLSYPANHPHRGILLEFIRQEKTIEGYLNVRKFQIPSFQGDLKQAKITLLADEKSVSFIVHRLAGGQRLHLTKQAFQCLVDLLHTHPEVAIQVGPLFTNI